MSLRQRANEAENQRQKWMLKTDELQNRLNSQFHQAFQGTCWKKVVLPRAPGWRYFVGNTDNSETHRAPVLTKAAFPPILMRLALSCSKTL